MKSMLLLMSVVTLTACATGGAVRNLSNEEMNILAETHDRLKTNRDDVHGAIDDLSDNLSGALGDQHSLQLSIAKAQLLESMKAPWVQTKNSNTATQREVVLYHLFALAEAEQAALDARLRERQLAFVELKKAYDLLVSDMGALVESQKILLAHLNQPTNARISAIIGTTLDEVKAFSETLGASDNPRLRALAANVEKYEVKVEREKDKVDEILEKIVTQRNR